MNYLKILRAIGLSILTFYTRLWYKDFDFE